MKILKQLIAVELSALASLLVLAVAMAAYGAIGSTLHPSSWLSPASSAQIVFGYTAVIGAAPALLLGAPGYLLLVHRNLARRPHVLLLGAAPGLLALIFDITLGFIAIICGAAVALLTHSICRRLGLTIRSSRPRIVASTACYALRLHAVAAPPRGGLTQALGI